MSVAMARTAEQFEALLAAQRWPRWLNLKQAAEYSGCAVDTFKRHLIKTGRVQAKVTDFGKRYDRDEIDQAIKNYY
ncbi:MULTISPECIES: hypothetical protein [Convivina]|uniref:Excisionase family DNA binding protein n=2 Tax=Convivina TaxID=1697027 RepID=A0A2U1D5X7_9LACO|nr:MULTISPECIES: hypothetical protein [Convivina]SDB98009.1 hypothetical protein SAMN05216341_10838 [Leuconostocaceae bacterium R-53105]PVY83091.1 hypothetical protein C7384_10939 [Convivina intestini]CAH1849972.1 hypothetical protein R078138_00039 [Convivina sp. LMG 32447]CAH1856159.1 hypothetical protein LMG032447_01244 [Convivina sp. LMG 32447]CAH1856614.1 hypothetical protein R077811_01292 [Convivina intestini]